MGEAKRRGTYEQRKATALKTDFKYQPIVHSNPVYSLLVFLGITVILLLVLYLFKELK